MPDRKLWVVGRAAMSVKQFDRWSLIGVFSTEEMALAACVEPNDFLGPVELDRAQHEDVAHWPGSYFPRACQDADSARLERAGIDPDA